MFNRNKILFSTWDNLCRSESSCLKTSRTDCNLFGSWNFLYWAKFRFIAGYQWRLSCYWSGIQKLRFQGRCFGFRNLWRCFLMCGLYRNVYADAQMLSSRTCCSFMAEACACQAALIRLFPDVYSLSLSYLLSPSPSLSSPTGLHLISNSSQSPVSCQLWAQRLLSLMKPSQHGQRWSCLSQYLSSDICPVVGGQLSRWDEIPQQNCFYSVSASPPVNTRLCSLDQSVSCL